MSKDWALQSDDEEEIDYVQLSGQLGLTQLMSDDDVQPAQVSEEVQKKPEPIVEKIPPPVATPVKSMSVPPNPWTKRLPFVEAKSSTNNQNPQQSTAHNQLTTNFRRTQQTTSHSTGQPPRETTEGAEEGGTEGGPFTPDNLSKQHFNLPEVPFSKADEELHRRLKNEEAKKKLAARAEEEVTTI